VRVYSDLVQTDVMVFDKDGRFVNGLKREDFELRIDGKPQPVEFFERVSTGSGNEEVQLAAARGGGLANGRSTSAVAVPLDRGRAIFFYVDDFHMSPGNLTGIRKVLNRYVDQSLGQNDMAAITSASGTIGFLQQLADNKTVLRAAVDRLVPHSTSARDLDRPPMTEYQALQIDHFDQDVTEYFVDELLRDNPTLGRQVATEMVRSRARQILQYSSHNTVNTLAGLERLVRSSSKLPGRKLVIFISDGFFLDDRNSDSLDRLRRVTSAAARSGVVIYSMDARGLVASLEDPSFGVAFDPTGRLNRGSAGELFASQDGMNALAKDTGGRTIFNTNALSVGLSKAINETSAYYLLAWRPNHETASDKFRRINVKLLSHPDYVVRVRQGFFDREPPPITKKSEAENKNPSNKPAPNPAETALRDSLHDSFPNTELPVAMNLSYMDLPKGTMATVSMQVNTDSLQYHADGSGLKGEVDIRGVVYNDQGKAGAVFTDHLTVNAASAERIKQSRKEIVYNFQVFLPAGIYQVRVAARDPATGRVGSAFEWIEIPDLAAKKLTLSSILAAEVLPASAVGLNERPAPGPAAELRVDRRFHRDAVLRFVLSIYNALKSPIDGKPDLGVQVLILRDQQPVVTTASKRVPTNEPEQFDRLLYGGDLSLEGLAPGRYILQISIVDRIAKTSATQKTKLDID
jgi:VWFA-related protein